MDRYDSVIRDIQGQTEEETLRWRSVPPSRYDNVLLNPDRVIRAYRAEYVLGKEEYDLIFIDRKAEHYDDYTDWAREKRAFEVLILGAEGEVVLRLYEGAVDQDDLAKLAGLIEGSNDRTAGFFEAFEKARGRVGGEG